MMAKLRAFGAFWYDFVIGDDWLVAAGVVLGLAGTYGLHRAGVTAWWLLPLVLVVLLPVSLSRAAQWSSSSSAYTRAAYASSFSSHSASELSACWSPAAPKTSRSRTRCSQVRSLTRSTSFSSSSA